MLDFMILCLIIGMQKILITGGAGFIGSHLIDFLLQKNFEIICIDNFITGDRENLSHLEGNSRVKIIEHDVREPFDFSDELSWVLHFASPASPKDYLKYPILTLETGSIGTKNMLELAKKTGAKFMLASTSEVYGDPLCNPQPESYYGNVNPIGKRSVYDEAKRFSEAITMAYHREYGLDIRIVRIFNTYGERMQMDDGRVIPNFVCQALKKEPLTVYGDGTQTRSFCYISDLVEGIWRVMNVEYHKPINLGNPNEMRIIDLAHLVLKLTGSSSKIIYKEMMEDDPKRRRPDITLAKKLLNWEPKVSLEEGLKRTIEYFRRKLGIR